MPGIDYSSHVTNPAAQGPAVAASAAQQTGPSDFSFSDFLDIVNPLQHIPVVSTLYRSITGDGIGIPEKIAGDTLYGGAMGLVASLADTAFQEITGKNVGDTVLAFLTGAGESSTAVAAAPASVTPATAMNLQTPDVSLLMSALSNKGVDGETATRASYAYSRSIGLHEPIPPPS